MGHRPLPSHTSFEFLIESLGFVVVFPAFTSQIENIASQIFFCLNLTVFEIKAVFIENLFLSHLSINKQINLKICYLPCRLEEMLL